MTALSIKMENEYTALNGTTTTTTKVKRGYTLLLLLTAVLLVCVFYAEQSRGMVVTLLVVASGITHGATAITSLTRPQEAEFIWLYTDDGGSCVVSVGTYDDTQDYCYSCGGLIDDDGTLVYCWNSRQCPINTRLCRPVQ